MLVLASVHPSAGHAGLGADRTPPPLRQTTWSTRAAAVCVNSASDKYRCAFRVSARRSLTHVRDRRDTAGRRQKGRDDYTTSEADMVHLDGCCTSKGAERGAGFTHQLRLQRRAERPCCPCGLRAATGAQSRRRAVAPPLPATGERSIRQRGGEVARAQGTTPARGEAVT
ncbi:hypothetical protein MTO96_001268 [Rhipicephalus appendiculatus]